MNNNNRARGGGSANLYAAMSNKQSKAQKEADRAKAQKAQEQKLRDLAASGPKYKSSINFDEFKDLKKYAYGTEDSPYAQMLREQALAQTSEGVDAAQRDSQAGLGNIYSQLAMGGGLSGGSRERLAGSAGEQALMARQGVRRAGDESQMNIGLQEAQAKQGAQESVLNAIKGDRTSRAQFDMDRWKMKTDQEAAIMKSQAEREVAAANSCLLEGTGVKLASG
jgi:hypothetical protein